MDKEKIIEILEDYEFFVDDDFGGHYEHINCSQKALTPLGIIEILDYISELEQQVKKQKEAINKIQMIITDMQLELIGIKPYHSFVVDGNIIRNMTKNIEDILKEVSE